ncbi:DUF1906 domain-containing protein [Kitasatospora purpeofusca]|uniref:DUF1906 domain-containing protein n=1 Tax=Kitasatospora purpeofusca TaxID=67352 RepID=A0ABZ1U446_9ACTN|nr:DUF1906 domain-containing protein [Kitasatospora purpeofusca]
MRYLRPAALAAASFVLLLAAGGPGASADETAPVVAAVPRIRATVLPDRVGPPAARARDLFTGAAFDACTAPPLETMRAWRDSSPYGAVGIYTSGSQRGCAQPRLGADWVRQARAMGWRFLPVHVGLQAPCSELSRKPKRIDPARAVQQGREEAVEAVRGLKAVGLGKGSPVFLDIEAYPLRDPACGQAVVDFTLGWTQALHLAGYGSGFYSSLDSGIADLAAAARAGSAPLPDTLWYARWDDRADTAGGGALAPDLWALRQRVHQYRGNVEETYGGATLTVDRNQVDAPLAG